MNTRPSMWKHTPTQTYAHVCVNACAHSLILFCFCVCFLNRSLYTRKHSHTYKHTDDRIHIRTRPHTQTDRQAGRQAERLIIIMFVNLHIFLHIDIDTLFIFTYKQSSNLRFMFQFFEGPWKRGQPAYVWETELNNVPSGCFRACFLQFGHETWSAIQNSFCFRQNRIHTHLHLYFCIYTPFDFLTYLHFDTHIFLLPI